MLISRQFSGLYKNSKWEVNTKDCEAARMISFTSAVHTSAVQAGKNFLKQIEEGGITVIRDIANFFGIRNIENNIDKAGEELSTGNTYTRHHQL